MLEIKSTDTISIKQIPNTPGFDGHCLRAYYYFKDQMPTIRQAEKQERCFRIKSETGTLLLKSGDLILLPDGTKIPVEQYFDSHP